MWDVFHADRLEVERALTSDAVRAALARGDLREDDLIRPAGTTDPWARLADFPALLAPPELSPPPPTEPLVPPLAPDLGLGDLRTEEMPYFPEDDEEDFEEEAEDEDEEDRQSFDAIIDEDEVDTALPASPGYGRDDLNLEDDESLIALPVSDEEADELAEEFDPQDEDEAAAEFTLSRGAAEKVEELDLAAMVDVAFQLVLFFLVTATTVLYKSLEVPKPNPESPAAGAQQGRARNIDDLKNDYILVEIDPAGVMKIDREPVAADMNALVSRLRSAREKTGRRAMLLTADFATPHRNAVLAYDAANEIGLGIAIARPAPPAPGAAPPPAPKKADEG